MEPTDPRKPEDTPEVREESARRVLQAFRERRRRRRGEDTYFGSAECFVQHAEASDTPDRERRRSELMEDADAALMPRDLAELLYDIALEEGLDPGLAFELVRCGLSVCPPPEGVSNESSAPATDRYLPSWMFPASPPDHMIRERTLHVSFRRIRGLLEQHHDVNEAFRRFANEPDVGHCGY